MNADSNGNAFEQWLDDRSLLQILDERSFLDYATDADDRYANLAQLLADGRATLAVNVEP